MRKRPPTARPAAPAILILLLALAPSAPVPAVPQETQDAVSTSGSIAAIMGRQSFRTYCATCHGTEGRGDGPIAEHLKVTPADLTRISERNGGEFPFDEMVKIIDGRETKRGHGSSDMPVWGDAFHRTREELDEEGVRRKIDELARFLQTIQEP